MENNNLYLTVSSSRLSILHSDKERIKWQKEYDMSDPTFIKDLLEKKEE